MTHPAGELRVGFLFSTLPVLLAPFCALSGIPYSGTGSLQSSFHASRLLTLAPAAGKPPCSGRFELRACAALSHHSNVLIGLSISDSCDAAAANDRTSGFLQCCSPPIRRAWDTWP